MTQTIDEGTQHQLVKRAIEAQRRAYAPYSNYPVGAALLGTDGRIFSGCNVENASTPAGICAERTAVVKAVSDGTRSFSAIAVVTRDGGSPCGICRQVLSEFAPTMLIIVANGAGDIQYTHTLDELLPRAFSPANLDVDPGDD